MKRKSYIGDKHPKPKAGRTIKPIYKTPTKKDIEKNEDDKDDKKEK